MLAAGETAEYAQWQAILASASAARAYQWVYRDRLEPMRIAELLILRPELPRSLVACFGRVSELLDDIAAEQGGRRGECHRLAGELHSNLRYARIGDIFEEGLHVFLTRKIERAALLGAAIDAFYIQGARPSAGPSERDLLRRPVPARRAADAGRHPHQCGGGQHLGVLQAAACRGAGRPGDRAVHRGQPGDHPGGLGPSAGGCVAGRPDVATLRDVPNMFQAARLVGAAVRAVYDQDGRALSNQNIGFDCSLLVGGQIGAEPPRLFLIYSAGNFIEATADTPFLQIGEHKYGKPILDRNLAFDTPLAEAVKLALVSMDSTIRSNLTVGLPMDHADPADRRPAHRPVAPHRRGRPILHGGAAGLGPGAEGRLHGAAGAGLGVAALPPGMPQPGRQALAEARRVHQG